MKIGKSSSGKAICLLIVSFLLCVIAFGIHRKAYQAVAPPIYDPISYYCKSQIVWDAIGHGHWKSAFDQFAMRPPGSALILYPLGFVPSINSFLFRSTLAPLVIWAMALMVILLPKIGKPSESATGTALAAGMLSLPIFYHFEIPIDSERACGVSLQWGMVDVLQASVAALALGLLYTGVKKNLNSLVVLAWAVGAYTFFIKPSGILVLGSLFPIYFTESMILWKQEVPAKKTFLIRHLALFGVGIGITVASIWLAVSSGYLSKEVIEAAKIGQKVLIQISNQSLWIQMDVLWKPVIGHWWIPAIVVTLLISMGSLMYSLSRLGTSDLGLRFATSMMVFASALYWWMTMAGQEHRYLFPFVMLILSWLIVPTLFDLIVQQGHGFRCFAIAYCMVPVFALITLLHVPQGKTTSKYERFFGFNLDSGQYVNQVKMGHDLLQEAGRIKRPIRIYSMGNHVGVVEMCDWVNSIEKPDIPHKFRVSRVNDWIHPGIKIKEVLASDFFLVGKNLLEPMPATPKPIIDWKSHEVELAKFIEESSLREGSGIRVANEDSEVKIFKVESYIDFAEAFRNWVSSHQWGQEFYEMNSYKNGKFEFPRLQVLDAESALKLTSTYPSSLPQVNFGNKITLLALWRNHQTDQGEDKLRPVLTVPGDLLTFLFRADQEIGANHQIFIHLLDKDKKILFQHDFQIDPNGVAIPAGTIWKSLVNIPQSELEKTHSIGFGAYIPGSGESFLQSDYKGSDWNGNRVLFQLNP